MKHKTWFRLVLKAIGILLLGISLPDLIDAVLMFSDIAFNWSALVAGTGTRASLLTGHNMAAAIAQSLPGLAQAAFGSYLFFDGKWILNKAIPSNVPYCPDCGYDLSKNSTGRCPECGVTLARAGGEQP